MQYRPDLLRAGFIRLFRCDFLIEVELFDERRHTNVKRLPQVGAVCQERHENYILGGRIPSINLVSRSLNPFKAVHEWAPILGFVRAYRKKGLGKVKISNEPRLISLYGREAPKSRL
jgi:hypothetical protein